MATTLDPFRANLALLRRTEPALAARVEAAGPVGGELNWSASKAGPVTATITRDGRTWQLASKYDPLAEARQLLVAVDHEKHAVVFVLGIGLGYHVAELVRSMPPRGIVVVYEPDAALLRAVLERIDHAGWLGRSNVIVLDDTVDRAGLIQRLERHAGTLTQGAVLVTHPPTSQLHGPKLAAFGEMVGEALAYCRTNVATSLVNASRTIRNFCLNLPRYAAGATTNELHRAAVGTPAVCVGAGPSLAKNVDLLCDPAVRRNVVVITAQTTLKPLLARGITPDFVTALDYHEISRRFYEGLPELPHTTLVAEPLANPTILDSYPGPIRVTHARFLDKLLGPELARPITPIPYGATVAHLSFYLAQHLGCDPVILIGQDLGFSDGLYYCPGTAIHDVWAPELNAFDTLEMHEWQRIVRHRSHLQKRDDIHGRAIYTDEQMLTYLKQFEKDFAAAASAGQRVIDATEGGLPKLHTTRMTLAEALREHATRPSPLIPLPASPRATGRGGFDHDRLAAAAGRLQTRLDEVRELRQLSVRTVPLLRQMIEHQRDRIRMERLFADLSPITRRVSELGEAFELVNELNTIGAFRRSRADRAIEATVKDELDEQARRLERDVENVEWIIQACDEAMTIFKDAALKLRTLIHTDAPEPTLAA